VTLSGEGLASGACRASGMVGVAGADALALAEEQAQAHLLPGCRCSDRLRRRFASLQRRLELFNPGLQSLKLLHNADAGASMAAGETFAAELNGPLAASRNRPDWFLKRHFNFSRRADEPASRCCHLVQSWFESRHSESSVRATDCSEVRTLLML